MQTYPNYIAGEALSGTTTFANNVVDGAAGRAIFAVGTPDLVDRAAKSAARAFRPYSQKSRQQRATFLRSIADEIEARAADLTAMGVAETGLPAGRLDGERGRTMGQLRMFADHLETGDYLDRRHDVALPDRTPMARPDLRLMQQPLGPVAVFGASNFPLAFSTAGGDTASALAAGCPVVVKGHPGHPGTASIVAEAIVAAVQSCDMPAGVFSLVNDGGPGNGGADSRLIGATLVQHPSIKAVGFTGSLAAGRALFDLACQREEPIPFFGELGSINPVFVLPAAAQARGESIARDWIASLTMGVGQFCTNPGILIIPENAADAFEAAAREAVGEAAPAIMLTEGIADAYLRGIQHLSNTASVKSVCEGNSAGRSATPAFYRISATDYVADESLSHEVFGPAGIIVVARDEVDMAMVAESLVGQLTATLQLDEKDHDSAAALLPILQEKAGRLLCNGFPTGVEVAASMMHGGPWPASTNASTTSVGTLAIRRFLRPIAYQNFPAALLPYDLQ